MNTCPYGVTQDELQSILGPLLNDFNRWMVGQTGSICDGRRYNFATCEYEATGCAGSPHGLLVYRSDLERYLRGRPVIDW